MQSTCGSSVSSGFAFRIVVVTGAFRATDLASSTLSVTISKPIAISNDCSVVVAASIALQSREPVPQKGFAMVPSSFFPKRPAIASATVGWLPKA